MSKSAWDIPTSSTTASRRPSVGLSLNLRMNELSAARCAPLMLTYAETSILLGLTESLQERVYLDRQYLVDVMNRVVSTCAVPTLSLAENIIGVSATSSFSTQGSTYSGAAARKGSGSHLDYVNADELNNGRDTRTTFMIRRLPRYLSAEQLFSLLNRSGYLKNSVDLIYVPVFTGKAHANRGYAFINFNSPQLGALFMTVVCHSSETELSKQLGRCDIVYAHIQSKDAMLANLTRVSDGLFWQEPTVPPGLLVLD